MIKSIEYNSLPGGFNENLDPIQAMDMAKSAGFDALELRFGEKYHGHFFDQPGPSDKVQRKDKAVPARASQPHYAGIGIWM